MKIVLLFIVMVIFLAHPCHVFAQTGDTNYIRVDRSGDYNQKKRLFAYYSINELRKGALLVMLHTRSKTIQLYRANKAPEIADRIKNEQTIENRSIVAAFRKEYNFSKVYFFYDDNMEDVLNGKRSGFFLDSNLVVDNSIKLGEDFFMVADNSPLEEESYEFAQEGGHPNSTQSSSSPYIIMRDSYFVQMRPPFPFNVATGSIKSMDRQVAELNNDLKRFYAKHFSANPEYPFKISKFFNPPPYTKP